MIGPSSSHTAGALRIAWLAGKLVKNKITHVYFTLYGSFAQTWQGHGTNRALTAGILGFTADDERIRDAIELANKQGIRISFQTMPDVHDVHPNTVDIKIEEENGKVTEIRGESIGGGAAEIRMLNGVDVDFTGEYSTIVIEQKDEKGVLAHIAKVLSDSDINIAFTKLFRKTKGETAYTIIETDEVLTDAVIEQIKLSPSILDATLIAI
jgi:L-serine dehydratase